MTAPLVAVIVLNYNGWQHLEYCLPSILATDYARLTVIVVDNASSDGSVEFVKQTCPQVLVVASPSNRGWAGGNNLGIAQARRLGADYVILANNDIRVDARWARQTVELAETDARIGIVGFRVFEASNLGADAAFEEAVAGWSALESHQATVIDGMAMLVRLDVFKQIGLIDEAFFAYAEDNDLVLRARKAGYHVLATNIPVWHRGQGSFGRVPLRAARLQIRNNLRLSLKHDTPAGVLYQVARHFAKGCLPFVKVDPHDQVARRLRPSNVVVNFGLFAYALAWNIWHLGETLRRRREDERRIAAARRRLENKTAVQ